MRGDGRGPAENIGGAGQILWALLSPWLRSRRERWGTIGAERERPWPGDDLIPGPRWQYLNAIAVAAAAEDVWPWVAQIGQGRGGFYSFERLENLVGCRIRNAEHLLGEHQAVSPGDEIRLAAGAPPLTVARVEPGRALVLTGGDLRVEVPTGDQAVQVSWAFFVEPEGNRACRVLSRYRARYGKGLGTELLYGPRLAGAIAFVMQRKMLRGIKLRAERAGRRDPAGSRDTLAG